MRMLVLAALLILSNIAAAKCEPGMRAIEEPDMQFILDRLPRLASARRVKPNLQELIPLMDWYAKYSNYKQLQLVQDKKEEREEYNSRLHFFEKIKDRKDGRDYAKGMINRDWLIAFRQKNKPVPLRVQELAFEKDIEFLIRRNAEAAKDLSVAGKRDLIKQILILAQNTATWREEAFGFYGWVNPLTLETNDIIDELAGLDIDPKYRRLRVERSDEEDEYSRSDPYSYDLETTNYLTTYNDYARLFASLNLKPGQTFLEIGAGFARAALVMDILYPDVQYKGYEIVPERIREANGMIKRLKIENAEIIKADVLDRDFKIATADFYFTYNPKEFNPLAALKPQLQKVAKQGDPLLIVIPERGQYRDEKAWLNRLRIPSGLRMIRPAEFYSIKTR